MPSLVNGQWVKGDVAASEMKGGAFHREATHFHNWITPDGAPGRARAESRITGGA